MIFLVLEEHWLLGLLSWIFSFGSPFNDTLLPEHTSSILLCILLQSLTVLWNLLKRIWHRAQFMLKEDWCAFDAMIREYKAYLNEGTEWAGNLHISRKDEPPRYVDQIEYTQPHPFRFPPQAPPQTGPTESPLDSPLFASPSVRARCQRWLKQLPSSFHRELMLSHSVISHPHLSEGHNPHSRVADKHTIGREAPTYIKGGLSSPHEESRLQPSSQFQAHIAPASNISTRTHLITPTSPICLRERSVRTNTNMIILREQAAATKLASTRGRGNGAIYPWHTDNGEQRNITQSTSTGKGLTLDPSLILDRPTTRSNHNRVVHSPCPADEIRAPDSLPPTQAISSPSLHLGGMLVVSRLCQQSGEDSTSSCDDYREDISEPGDDIMLGSPRSRSRPFLDNTQQDNGYIIEEQELEYSSSESTVIASPEPIKPNSPPTLAPSGFGLGIFLPVATTTSLSKRDHEDRTLRALPHQYRYNLFQIPDSTGRIFVDPRFRCVRNDEDAIGVAF